LTLTLPLLPYFVIADAAARDYDAAPLPLPLMRLFRFVLRC